MITDGCAEVKKIDEVVMNAKERTGTILDEIKKRK